MPVTITKIMTGMFPYLSRYLPEKKVKHEAAITPIIIKKSPFNVRLKLLLTLYDKQNDTPRTAIKTARDLFIVIFSILKKNAINMVQSGMVA